MSQAGAAPHAQTPLLVHESDRSGSHDVQLRPDLPHDLSWETSQTPSRQQPLGHDTASHLHTPPVQCRPGPHAGPLPQEQMPLVQ
jgi:hypothetical protein